MSGREGCRGFGDKPSFTCSDRNMSLLGKGERETEAAGPRQTSSCKSDSRHEGSAVGRYLNSGVSKQRSAHIGRLYLQAQSHPRRPRLVAPPYAGTQEISVRLPSLGPGVWLVLCRQVRKRVPARKKKKQKSPLWRSPPAWVHQDACPRVPTATSCPHSLLCLTEGLKLFTDSGHKATEHAAGL